MKEGLLRVDVRPSLLTTAVIRPGQPPPLWPPPTRRTLGRSFRRATKVCFRP